MKLTCLTPMPANSAKNHFIDVCTVSSESSHWQASVCHWPLTCLKPTVSSESSHCMSLASNADYHSSQIVTCEPAAAACQFLACPNMHSPADRKKRSISYSFPNKHLARTGNKMQGLKRDSSCSPISILAALCHKIQGKIYPGGKGPPPPDHAQVQCP